MNKYLILLSLILFFCIFSKNENFVVINSHLRDIDYNNYDLITQEDNSYRIIQNKKKFCPY